MRAVHAYKIAGTQLFFEPAEYFGHHQCFGQSFPVAGKKQFAVIADCLNPDYIIRTDCYYSV